MSNLAQELRVPRDTVNDDFVTVVRWLYNEGDEVTAGKTLVELETSKSVIDVESPATGLLCIQAAPGEQVEVGAVLGTVAPAGDYPRQAKGPSPAASLTHASRATAPQTGGDTPRTVSKAAQALIQQHDIAEDDLPAGLVREVDVQSLIDRRSSQAGTPARTAPGSTARPKGLLGDARRSAGDRNVSILGLALNYLFRNWLLGNVARISPRGVITMVHRLRGVKIGANCFIDPNAILETAYPENITLGTDVRVAAGAVVMTHIKPPHFLRDAGIVPTVVQPVLLDDHCFVGVNAVVMPGVTVGRASVVASGAVVTSNVPPLSMVAGNPARVIKRFRSEQTTSHE
jgi:acetyltransferase-like isoleucine patch superfamily enzyme